jgi:hypothetical protein
LEAVEEDSWARMNAALSELGRTTGLSNSLCN